MKPIELFDIGNKGFLNKNEQLIFDIFNNCYQYNSDDILGMEINETNINELINKFDLKINKNDVKELVNFINR